MNELCAYISPVALKAFTAPSQIGKNGEGKGFCFIYLKERSLGKALELFHLDRARWHELAANRASVAFNAQDGHRSGGRRCQQRLTPARDEEESDSKADEAGDKEDDSSED